MFRSVIRSIIHKIQKPRLRKQFCAALRAASTGQKRYVQKPLEYLEEEKRCANDGKTYTKAEFQEYYRDSWQLRWDAASPDKAQERILSLEKRILSLETDMRKRDANAPLVNRKRMVSDVLHGMAPPEAYTSIEDGGPYRSGSGRVFAGRDEEEDGQDEEDYEEEEDDYDPDASLTELLKNGGAFEAGAVTGNIYRHWGFGQTKRQRTALAGQVFVMLIQLTAPAAIFVWNLYALNLNIFGDAYSIGFRHLLYKHGSDDHGVSNITKNVLTCGFLFAFMLNAVQSNYEDARSWQKCVMLKRLFQHSNKKIARRIVENARPEWFVLGPMINCQCLLFCCIDTFLLMYTSVDNVSDVVMNVLAVFFLYKMDDIGCDLDFFDLDDWDPQLMGQLLYDITKYQITKPKWYLLRLTVFKVKAEEDWATEVDASTCCDLLDKNNNQGEMVQGPHPCHLFTTMILWLFVFLLPVAFIFVEGFTVAAEEYEIQELKDKLLELNVTVP